LGKTGENVSILCLGGWHIRAVQDDKEAIKIMHAAIDETERRRIVQREYNEEHGITPLSIRRAVENPLAMLLDGERVLAKITDESDNDEASVEEIPSTVKRLRKEMKEAAAELDFEAAASLRDRIRRLEQIGLRR
jgi:excinuclease ABC subunit B